MKTLKTLIMSVGAVALLGATGLSAQTEGSVQIPFGFTVQNTTLPAGPYAMKRVSPTSAAMAIRNVETGEAIYVMAHRNVSELKDDKDNVVLFHRIGDHYFLAEVKTEGVCGHVGVSKLERELASEGSGQPMAAVIVPALSVR